MRTVQRLLLPVDFSRCTDQAALFACTLCKQLQAELHLLHVLEKHASTTPVFVGGLAVPTLALESRHDADQALLAAINPRDALGLPITRVTAEGEPAVEIARYAQQADIDLIVMGSHGRTGLRHLLLGSVAERVIREAACPVLVVHPSR